MKTFLVIRIALFLVVGALFAGWNESYGADVPKSASLKDSLQVAEGDAIYVKLSSLKSVVFVITDEVDQDFLIVDEFRPWTSPLDKYWSIPVIIGLLPDDVDQKKYKKNEFGFMTIKLPQNIPDEYLTRIVDDTIVGGRPLIVSDEDARWAVVSVFLGYKKGEPRYGERITSSKYDEILVYADRNVVVNSDVDLCLKYSPLMPKKKWKNMELKKGWNRLGSDAHNFIHLPVDRFDEPWTQGSWM